MTDAERLAAAKRGQNWLYAALEMIGDADRTDHDLAKVIVDNESDLLALIEQFDAAQKALDELAAETERLKLYPWQRGEDDEARRRAIIEDACARAFGKPR
jgi:hypothetical protein